MSGFTPLRLTDRQVGQLASLGIDSLPELLEHFPFRYEYIAEADLRVAEIGSKVCFSGLIVSPVTTSYFAKKRRQSFKIAVKGEIYEAVIFNRSWISKLTGKELTFFGQLRSRRQVLISNYNSLPLAAQLGWQSIYRKNRNITNRELQKLIGKALQAAPFFDDLPEYLTAKYRFMPLNESYQNIHFPLNDHWLEESRRRLKYQKLFLFNLGLLAAKKRNRKEKPPKQFSLAALNAQINKLPWPLNPGQAQALNEILEDLRFPYTMLRLLQGEVGSGKTVVAALAMLACANSGWQAVLLAPTELLAKQHWQKFLELFPQAEVCLLTAALPAKEQKLALAKIAAGRIKIIIGTHRLFQDDVLYADLGLVVADEQQRFGVNQRQQLIEKGLNVDVLQMSATPIPRTIALSLYADMDVSLLSESIYGRAKVNSRFVPQNSFFAIRQEIEELLDGGSLCYIVCAAISEDTTISRNVESLVDSLQTYYSGRYLIAGIHGRLTDNEAEKIMTAFRAGKYQILVATSIIEVGIDVPVANIMIIYNAERFGLSQLHQLRGRIGRAGQESYCYFLSDPSEEEDSDNDIAERLRFITANTDGAAIAAYDFTRRGFGDIAGIRQSGPSFFQLFDPNTDLELLRQVYEDAREYLNNADCNDRLLLKLLNASIIKN